MTQAFKAHEVGAAKDIVEHVAYMEPTPKRVRVIFNGETIADSRRVLIMFETKHQPVYYFPLDDVRMDLMQETPSSTF
jgi:uncharacterized protein (DUF427 family)